MFVILSLALLVASLGLVLVAVQQLTRSGRQLSQAVDHARSRIVPITEQLQGEAAVTAAESDRLRRRLDARQRNLRTS